MYPAWLTPEAWWNASGSWSAPRRSAIGELDGWIEQAKASLIAPLARGVAKDKAAVRAAITEPWSNGQTEGQINRLKMIKRQMYGRAKLDLLEARLIGSA